MSERGWLDQQLEDPEFRRLYEEECALADKVEEILAERGKRWRARLRALGVPSRVIRERWLVSMVEHP